MTRERPNIATLIKTKGMVNFMKNVKYNELKNYKSIWSLPSLEEFPTEVWVSKEGLKAFGYHSKDLIPTLNVGESSTTSPRERVKVGFTREQKALRRAYMENERKLIEICRKAMKKLQKWSFKVAQRGYNVEVWVEEGSNLPALLNAKYVLEMTDPQQVRDAHRSYIGLMAYID